MSFEDYLKKTGEVGHVKSIIQSLVYVSGLPNVRLNELVINENNQKGIVQAAEEGIVEVLMLTSKRVQPNVRFTRTQESLKIPVSVGFLGRVIDPLGLPLDGLGPISGQKTYLPTHRVAPPLSFRKRIEQQLETGVSIVDSLVPIGLGQRELIVGDQKTGRTTFLLQAAAAHASKGGVVVYVGIGRKKSEMKSVEEFLKKTNSHDKSILMFTSSADPASMVYLAPFSGFTVAEYFRDLGKNVLILLDDLTTHAKFYREIALLSKRMPARDSYPGDIFHLHAHLLERAGLIKRGTQSVSITALPVVETVQGDLTGYLPTNAMAMTDGHLFFDPTEFKKGRRPAINTSLSVTRVGNQTQSALDKDVRKVLVEKLNNYKKSQDISHFGFDLPLQTRTDISLGERLEAIFDQESYTIVPKLAALILFGLVLNQFWGTKPIEQLRVERTKIVDAYNRGFLKDLSMRVKAAKNTAEIQEILSKESENITKLLYSNITKKEESLVEKEVKKESTTKNVQ